MVRAESKESDVLNGSLLLPTKAGDYEEIIVVEIVIVVSRLTPAPEILRLRTNV